MNQVEFQVGIKNRESIDRISFRPEDTNATLDALNITDTGVTLKTKAQASIGQIDDAIMNVSEMRARFGALQNRLQSTINNLSVTIENQEAANSRVRDTDVAQVSAELAKDTILQQASASVMAQANQNAQIALKLL